MSKQNTTKMISPARTSGAINKINVYSRSKKGWFDDGTKRYYMRSSWEFNYAYYLNFLMRNNDIKNWEYEVDTFWFDGIKRGVMSYNPDFKVFNNDGTITYHEVKGYMDSKSKTKIKRMAKYHPKINLIVIAKKEYDAIKRKKGLIKGWI